MPGGHRARTKCGSARRAWRKRLDKLAPQLAYLAAIRAELPEDGIFVDEVTQVGFAARLAFPVYQPRTFLSPGYQDNLGWGFATALGAQDARRDVPVRGDLRRRRFPVHRERDGDRDASPHSAGRRSSSTTAPSAMSAASSRSATATG